MKKYKKFTVTAVPFNPEVLSGILWELDIDGINEEVNCLQVFSGGSSLVTTEEINSQLQKLIDQKILTSFEVEEDLVEEINWNEEWEKSVNIIEISDKIVIKPTFKEYQSKKDQIVIEINPKMSFGTGEHQTTKLVLLLLEKYIEKDMKFLDVGTGTGILAIAAVKLGASSAIAIDNDEWSYENCKENSLLNNVNDKIDIRLTEADKISEKNFDIITANIQKNILLDIADELKKKLAKDGILILSGLLLQDETDIREKYESLNLDFIESEIMDDWLAVVFKKNI